MPHATDQRFRRLPELLAPAGGPAAFDAAVAAGADAIYVGYGQDLNARRGAESLEGDSFSEHVRKAHLAGTRVYVTMNIVIKDDELPHALAVVREAWARGADAFIVQDLGLMREIHLRWPQIELHASTQMNVHDARGALWCRDQGLARVTVSRELSVGELATIAGAGIEVEGFGHGALCFCYSGICLMSSATGSRSANRGMCAQPCRLLYALVDERGEVLSQPGWDRPLCPKDLCTIDHLAELRDAGIASLKVEGRLKAPDYVLSVGSAYREALDALCEEGGSTLGAEQRASIDDRLRRSFNRDFTDAYLRGRSGNDMMSFERSNNRGELVGEVVSSRDLGSVMVRRGGSEGGRERFRRMTRAEVTVALQRPVGKGDLLEVRPVDDPSQFLTGLAEADAAAGERIVIKTARPMPAGCPVRVIRSQRALDAAAQVNAAVPRKRPVAVRVRAELGTPLVVELEAAATRADAASGQPVVARAEGPVVEAARTKEVSLADLREHVCRMGATPFDPISFEARLDAGVGMSFSAVHHVRADACRALEEALLAPWQGRAGQLASAPDADDLAAELWAGARGEQGGSPLPFPSASGSLLPFPSRKGPKRGKIDGNSSIACVADGNSSIACEADGNSSEANAAVGNGSEPIPAVPEPAICVLAPTPEHAAAACRAGATHIYATADDLASHEGWPAGVVPWLDEVCRVGDHDRLDAWVKAGQPVAVGNISELALSAERGAYPEVRTTIPIHNAFTLKKLAESGAHGAWLSGELSLEEACSLAHSGRALGLAMGIVAYGRDRAMTSEHCVLQVADRCCGDCSACELRGRDLSLRDKEGRLWPVRTDLQGRSRIYAPRPIDASPQVGELVAAGVSCLMVDATLLSPAEAEAAVRRVASSLAAARDGRAPAPRQASASSGHLFAPIL